MTKQGRKTSAKARAGAAHKAQKPWSSKDESVVDAVRRQFNDLSPVQRRIAEYFINNPETIAFATVDQVAFELDTNPSTIVRFAYRLGLKGYPDLQERTRHLVRGRLSAASEIINENSILTHLDDSIFGSSLGQDLQNIRRTITSINVEQLTKACEMIAKSHRVFVAGAYGSYGICYSLALALQRAQGNVVLWGGHDGMVSAQAIDLSPADCLIAFTAVPYSIFIHRLVRQAKDAGAKVVGVTDSVTSGVGQMANLVIIAPSGGVGSQKSLVASMAVATALINGVARANRSRTLDRYARIKHLMRIWEVSEAYGKDDESPDSE